MDTSSSSCSQSKEEENWSEVDRKKNRQRKQRERINKRKDKMQKVASKMQYMIGVGPIEEKSVKFVETGDRYTGEARKMAVKEYLRYNLDFDQEELENLMILDTKQAAKDKIIYCALQSQAVKEIHYRKEASEDDRLVTRNYVLPQYFARYMAIAKKASQRRAGDKFLKTQICWGEKDVEIFTKLKGSQEPLKKTDLKEFMGTLYCQTLT